MDEIKLNENPKEPLETQPLSEEPQVETVTSEHEVQKNIPKKFIYLVAAIVIIFLALASFTVVRDYFFSPTGNVVTLNDLFLKNLEGDLPEDQGYVYNGFSFVNFDGLWYTEVQFDNHIFQVPLHFGPKELEDIPVTGYLDDSFDQEEVYLTFDPLTSDDYFSTAMSELAQNLAVAIHRKPIGACVNNESYICHSRPIVDCSDTDKAVIYLVKEASPEIELKGNCVILKGQEYDIIKVANRLVYEWYEVFKSP